MSQDNLNASPAPEVDEPTDPLTAFEYEGSDEAVKPEAKTEAEVEAEAKAKAKAEAEAEAKTEAEVEAEAEAEAEAETETETEAEAKAKAKAEAEAEAAKTPKKKESVKERIAAITKKRRDAERAVEVEASRNSELEEENAALKAKLSLTPDDNADKDELTAPDPADKKYEYGQLDDKYIADREAYLEDKITAKVRAEQDQSRQTDAAQKLSDERRGLLDIQIEQGVTKFDDYEAKVFEGGLNDLPPASPEAADLILQSEHSADLMYHMAGNLDEVKAVLGKSPIEQARYIGTLEAKFSSESTKPKAKSKPKAPAAQQPLSKTRSGGGKLAVGDDTDDFAAFKAKHQPD